MLFVQTNRRIMNTLFWVCCLILLTEAIAKNVAIPSPGTACKKAITFPITVKTKQDSFIGVCLLIETFIFSRNPFL